MNDADHVNPTWATITKKYNILSTLKTPEEILKGYEEMLATAFEEKYIENNPSPTSLNMLKAAQRLEHLTMASVENNLGELARAIKYELKLSWKNLAQELNIKAGTLKCLTDGDFCGLKKSQKDPFTALETLASRYSDHNNKRVRLLCQKLQKQVNLTKEFQEKHKDCLSSY